MILSKWRRFLQITDERCVSWWIGAQNCCPVWELLWRSRARAVRVPGPPGLPSQVTVADRRHTLAPCSGPPFPWNHPRSDKSQHQLHQGPQAVSLRLCSSVRSPPQPSFRASLVVQWSGCHAGDTSSIPGRGRSHMLRSNSACEPQLVSRSAATIETCMPKACAPPQWEAFLSQSRCYELTFHFYRFT